MQLHDVESGVQLLCAKDWAGKRWACIFDFSSCLGFSISEIKIVHRSVGTLFGFLWPTEHWQWHFACIYAAWSNDIQCSSLLHSVGLLQEKELVEFFKSLDNAEHSTVLTNADKLLSTYGVSYISEQGFSLVNLNKSTVCSRVTDEHLHSVMHIACSNLIPNVEKLTAVMPYNVFH